VHNILLLLLSQCPFTVLPSSISLDRNINHSTILVSRSICTYKGAFPTGSQSMRHYNNNGRREIISPILLYCIIAPIHTHSIHTIYIRVSIHIQFRCRKKEAILKKQVSGRIPSVLVFLLLRFLLRHSLLSDRIPNVFTIICTTFAQFSIVIASSLVLYESQMLSHNHTIYKNNNNKKTVGYTRPKRG